MDKVLEGFLKSIVLLLQHISGYTKYGDTVITASGAVGTYENGHAVYCKLLAVTTFNHFFINQVDVVAKKGYSVALPEGTILRPGQGNEITGYEIAVGGMVQNWE